MIGILPVAIKTLDTLLAGNTDELPLWRIFEPFVRNIYEGHGHIDVRHNAKVRGQSGISRQVDVLVTVGTPMTILYVLVECKYWRRKISLREMDQFVGRLDDYPGYRGVMFTAAGYTANARKRARKKNIDIFVIREVNDEEWGEQGRAVEFDELRIYTNVKSIIMERPRYVLANGEKLVGPDLDVTMGSTRFKRGRQEYDLYDEQGNRRNNLEEIVYGLREQIINGAQRVANVIPDSESSQTAYRSHISLSMDDTAFPYLRRSDSLVQFDNLKVDLLLVVEKRNGGSTRQFITKFTLMVENCCNRQRFWMHEGYGQEKVSIRKFVKARKGDKSEILFPGISCFLIPHYEDKPVVLEERTEIIEGPSVVVRYGGPTTIV